jgi:hypothetical protein
MVDIDQIFMDIYLPPAGYTAVHMAIISGERGGAYYVVIM